MFISVSGFEEIDSRKQKSIGPIGLGRSRHVTTKSDLNNRKANSKTGEMPPCEFHHDRAMYPSRWAAPPCAPGALGSKLPQTQDVGYSKNHHSIFVKSRDS